MAIPKFNQQANSNNIKFTEEFHEPVSSQCTSFANVVADEVQPVDNDDEMAATMR